MRYNKIAEIYVKGLVQEDDFGGYVEKQKMVGTVKAFLTPATDELTIENNVIVKVTLTKLFSKQEIPDDVTLVKCDGKEYEVLAYTDFGKVTMLKLVEVK